MGHLAAPGATWADINGLIAPVDSLGITPPVPKL